MEKIESESERDSTIELLNSFFSNISYNYYDVPMAMVLSYYKKQFKPLTLNEIYLDITSNEKYKEKLRKPNGQEYTRIHTAIQRIIAFDVIFKQIKDKSENKEENENNPENEEEPKYSIDINGVISYWNTHSAIMKKDYLVKRIEKNKNKMKKLISKRRMKHISNLNSNNNNKEFSSNKYFLMNKKIRRSKRLKFRSSLSTRKPLMKNNKNIHKIYDKKISDFNLSLNEEEYKEVNSLNTFSKENKFISNNKDMDINSEELSEILKDQNFNSNFNTSSQNLDSISNNTNNVNNKLLNLFNNSIYDIWPKLDENCLEEIVDDFTKLEKKINSIKKRLQDLKNFQSKYFTQLAEDDKYHAQKEKEKFFNICENIKYNLIKQNSANSRKDKLFIALTIDHEKQLLKENINNYLSIYEQTYNNLCSIIYDRKKNFSFIKEIKNGLMEDLIRYEKNLENFLGINISKVNKASEFLQNHSKKYIELSLTKTIDKIEDILKKKKNEKEESNFESEEISNDINNNEHINKKYLYQSPVLRMGKYSKFKDYILNSEKPKKHIMKRNKTKKIINNNNNSYYSYNQINGNNINTNANEVKRKGSRSTYKSTKKKINNINIISEKKKKNEENNHINFSHLPSFDEIENSDEKPILKEPLFLKKDSIDKENGQNQEQEFAKDSNSNISLKTSSLNNFSVSTMAGLDPTKIKEAIIEENETKKIDFEDVDLKNNINNKNYDNIYNNHEDDSYYE